MRHHHRLKALKLFLLLSAVVIVSAGCQGKNQTRRVEVKNGQETVILNNLETILPKEGAAIAKQVIENYRGYDFITADTVLGYRFSATVFGDDRGLWPYNMTNKAFQTRLAIDDIPRTAKLSKDKTKLVVIPEGPGTSDKMLLHDMDKHVTEVYPFETRKYAYSFNWQFGGEGLTQIEGMGNDKTIFRVDPTGKVNQYTLAMDADVFIDAGNLQSDENQLYYTKVGQNSGIFKYSWTTQKTEQILAQKTIRFLRLAPDQKKFAVVTGFQDNNNGTISIVGTDGKKHYDVYEGLNAECLEWQPDGKGLAFVALNENGFSHLYHADLVDGQLHFLGEYPSYSVEALAFSPNSEKLLVGFMNRDSERPGWMTHILTITEGEKQYEQ